MKHIIIDRHGNSVRAVAMPLRDVIFAHLEEAAMHRRRAVREAAQPEWFRAGERAADAVRYHLTQARSWRTTGAPARDW